MTSDEVYKLAKKFWTKVINDSSRFKGKEKEPETLQLRDNLVTLTVGKAVKSKLVSKLNDLLEQEQG